jgi:hypothetical protein
LKLFVEWRGCQRIQNLMAFPFSFFKQANDLARSVRQYNSAGLAVPERDHHASREITTWNTAKGEWSNPDIVDLAADAGRGVVMLRPAMLRYAQDPVMLHELLHAYHARLMPNGFENRGIKQFYNQAQSKQVYDKDAYALKNHKP